MSEFLRRRALSRRTFLRGSGALVALPWLDAMVPALAQPATPRRCMFLYAPNGKTMEDWRPKETGARFDLPHLLEPLAKHRRRMLVLTGLDLDGGSAHGDGPGDHARAAASFLTTAHPRKTGGADIHNGISIDQAIAQKIGDQTRFPSLELGLERGRPAGVCDSGYACAYTNNISWSSPSTPVAKETNPREVFRRLFGDAASRARMAKDNERRRSVLDTVLEDTKTLARRLSRTDRARIDEYLDAVRSVEKRLAQSADESAQDVPMPVGLDEGGGHEQRVGLMYELCALALQTDTTRVITLMLGNAGSNLSYRFLDVPEGHHSLSHHRNDPAKIDKIRKINRWHTEQLAKFVDRLASIDTGDGDLLDASLVLYGSGLADGNAHRHADLPILLLGRGGGDFKSGQHVRSKKHTPLGNLYVSIMQSMGLRTTSFGDSTGALL
ncbi:MAG: DUF1552 domain-containing protein [Planctomycetes bacterium]|nr:DUF1552 domain-containing protein [Planctomycetota bacterium]